MNQTSCTKCGASLGINAAGGSYCETCKVRLGYIPWSVGVVVRPGPADYQLKQQQEPIIREWLLLDGKWEEEPDDETEKKKWQTKKKRPTKRKLHRMPRLMKAL